MRALGWITFIGAGVMGTLLAISSIDSCADVPPDGHCEMIDAPMMIGGAGIALGGGLAGFLMTRKRDEAVIGAAGSPMHTRPAMLNVRGVF